MCFRARILPAVVVAVWGLFASPSSADDAPRRRLTVCVFDAGTADVKFWTAETFRKYVDDLKRPVARPADRMPEEWNRHCDSLANTLSEHRILFLDVVEQVLVDGQWITVFAEDREPVPILLPPPSKSESAAAGTKSLPSPAAVKSPLPPHRLTPRVIQFLTRKEGRREIVLELAADVFVDKERHNTATYSRLVIIEAAKGIAAPGIVP
jgi:hypothetical protein